MKESKGTLIVPKNVRVHLADPAIVMQVKKTFSLNDPKHLFLKPPAYAKSHYKNALKDLSSVEIVESPNNDITKIKKVMTDIGEDSLIIGETFSGFLETTKILAREFEYEDEKAKQYVTHPFLLEVATFQSCGKKREDMPESGNEINIKKQGYMFKDDVTVYNETHKKFSGNIFNHRPDKSDIFQGRLGCCFLLSSIISILSHENGADFILNMMRQQDDGTTIVRLFHPQTGNPIYLKVKNSFYSLNEQSFSFHKEPWIHILEKAYAGLAIASVFNEYTSQTNYESQFQSYYNIYGEGGNEDLALRILTGNEAKCFFINETIYNPFNLSENNLAKGAFLAYERLLQENLPKDEADKKEESIINLYKDLSTLFKLLNYNFDLYLSWGRYITELEKNKFLFNEFNEIIRNSKDSTYSAPKNIDQALYLVEQIQGFKVNFPDQFPDLALDTIKKNVSSGKMNDEGFPIFFYPGRAGVGSYTESQVNLFNNLKKYCQEDRLIACSTQRDFDDVPGLRSRHCYSLISVHEKIINNATLLMIKLRNPWGKVGRTYNFEFKKFFCEKLECADEDADLAEFEIDLCDFANYFHSYSVGELAANKLTVKSSPLQAAMPKTSVVCRFFKPHNEIKKDDLPINTLNAKY